MPGPDYLTAVWQLIVSPIQRDDYFGDYGSPDRIYQRYDIVRISDESLMFADAETGWVLRPEYRTRSAFRNLVSRYRRSRAGLPNYRVKVVACFGDPPLSGNARSLCYEYSDLCGAVSGAIRVSKTFDTAKVTCQKAQRNLGENYWLIVARYRNGKELH